MYYLFLRKPQEARGDIIRIYTFFFVVHVAGVNKRPIRSYVYTTLPYLRVYKVSIRLLYVCFFLLLLLLRIWRC